MSAQQMDRAEKAALDREEISLVSFQNKHGTELRGTPIRISRYLAVFEVYNPGAILQASEVLTEFQIVGAGRTSYQGRAVLRNIVHTGAMLVCEATLEDGWLDVDFSSGALGKQWGDFLENWRKTYQIMPAYKTIVADMQSFLFDLRLWLDQVELGIRSAPSGDRLKAGQDAVHELSRPVLTTIDALFAKFEEIAAGLEPDLLPAHRAFMKRQLHPLILCSPFAYRTYAKPLGYAGDYEMVNMMLREEFEGSSLFAKMVNLWFVRQVPAAAHRNRIDYLIQALLQETLRVLGIRPSARILNLGCGPAVEIQRFLAQHDVSSRTNMTLIDFNEETLRHVSAKMNEVQSNHHRSASIQFQKKSVFQILKESGRVVSRNPEAQYDLIYCAGLFDYVPDHVCQRMMDILYHWLAPGGLLLTTNVHPSNPMRNGMEHLLDWNLIYRDVHQAAQLKPEGVHPDNFSVQAELTGVNIFMAARKSNVG
jgi:extracellular factor (EF) 3-hydroxypalmitic acid methyl ester biosynthesis protein